MTIDFSLNSEIKTAFKFYTFELSLTEKGLKNYKIVLALVFEYIRKVRDEWLYEEDSICLF